MPYTDITVRFSIQQSPWRWW